MKKNKKIGICSCFNSHNYGSMLQAYATQYAIEKSGYNSEFIVYKKKKNLTFIIKQVPRVFNSNLMSDKMLVIKKKLAMKKFPGIQAKEKLRSKAFESFKKNYYRHFSNEYYGYDTLVSGTHNYDAILVGSDQLWTPGGLASNFYNLMFVPDEINKVSYATSFGVSNIPWYQKSRTKTYLHRINHLSVREVRGAQIIKEISGIEAKVVVDPTLLLTQDEWTKVIPGKRIVEEPYIFCYFLGENELHRFLAEELQEKTGLKIVCTPHLDSFVKRDLTFGDEQLFDIGPDGFVNLIRNADLIITDSFHGTIFSILYHKKFITFNRFSNGVQSRNSRIDSLLNLTGLIERRFSKNILEEISSEIDYTKVDKSIENLREDSYQFLKSSLGKEETKF